MAPSPLMRDPSRDVRDATATQRFSDAATATQLSVLQRLSRTDGKDKLRCSHWDVAAAATRHEADSDERVLVRGRAHAAHDITAVDRWRSAACAPTENSSHR